MDAYYFTHSSFCQIYNKSIVNSLDRLIGDTFFTKDAFADSLPLWRDVPLVFAQEHPDPFLFEKDRKAALLKVKGRIVGKGSNPRIEGDKLLLSLRICDKDLLSLQEEGELSLSSAFLGVRDTAKRLRSIQSVNHILLFKRDDKNMPRDSSVQIKNSEMNAIPKEYLNKFKPVNGYASELALIVACPRLVYALHPEPEAEANKQAEAEANKRLDSESGYCWDAVKKVWY